MFRLFEMIMLSEGAKAVAASFEARKAMAKEKAIEEVRRAKASFSSKDSGFRANFEPWTEDDRFAMFRNED